ncbi:MAG: SH3 domain-containing protein [Bacteroidota bacterium]|nr:SH3 domain-containing protein [Bacteroidota bacterium]
MRKRILIMFISCLIVLPLIASAATDEASKLFEEGNKLYLDQNYTGAVQKYEQILHSGYENGELYFNLGNAYYKLGNTAEAILNYERAQQLLPNDDDVQFNLRLANLQVVDKIDAVPKFFLYRWFDSLLTVLPLFTLGWTTYTLFLLTLIFLSVFLLSPSFRAKRLSLAAALAAGTLLVLSLVLFTTASYREANTSYAIVMSDVANIKSAPDTKGSDLFVLHKGVKVQVLDEVNDWKKIRLADGKVGWIPENECEVI